MSLSSARLTGLLAGLLLLAGCAATGGPLYGPDSPRNGAGAVVDPRTGTVIPGWPTGGGGSAGMGR